MGKHLMTRTLTQVAKLLLSDEALILTAKSPFSLALPTLLPESGKQMGRKDYAIKNL